MDELSSLIDLVRPVHAGAFKDEIKQTQCTDPGHDWQMLLDHKHPTVKEIAELACGPLIHESGRCNWDNIRALENALPGVSVTQGDGDSFGWLTGCINTDHGTIVYG